MGAFGAEPPPGWDGRLGAEPPPGWDGRLRRRTPTLVGWAPSAPSLRSPRGIPAISVPTRVLRTDERASGVSASELASLRTPLVRDFVASRRIRDGGGGGIRTHDTLLTYTGFRDRRLQPLGHPSREGT